MEIKIGVQNVNRELVLETDAKAEEITAQIETALNGGSPLVLKDSKGRTVLVPTQSLAYVELGVEEVRFVGFGSS